MRGLAWMLALAVICGCRGDLIDEDAPPVPAETGDVQRKPATVGVGKRGHGYGGGPFSTPIATLFRTKELIAFNLQVQPAMNMYRALNGHFPKSHDEFMEKIIKENHIQLPDLSAGERYVYDPEKAAQKSTYDPQDPPLFAEKDR